MKNEKTNKGYWDKSWGESKLWRYNITKYTAVRRRFDKLFKSFLERSNNKKILEIGCAKGDWLIYFANEFGYEPYGIDYSEIGCKMAEENFKVANVNGKILCEDIFKTSLENESFDVIYSMGLIEHFEDPTRILDKHIELLTNGGILIITIPNFKSSIYRFLAKIFSKEREIIEFHNIDIMEKAKLNKLCQNKGIRILMLDYFGPVNIALVGGDAQNKVMQYLLHIINQMIGYLTFYLKSRHYSPYIVLIAKKVGTDESNVDKDVHGKNCWRGINVNQTINKALKKKSLNHFPLRWRIAKNLFRGDK